MQSTAVIKAQFTAEARSSYDVPPSTIPIRKPTAMTDPISPSSANTVTALDLGPDASRDAQLESYFKTCCEKLGYVPNVLQAYAFDATKLAAFIAMADDLMLGESGLTRLEREMIAVAVSALNHCHYCLTAHGAAVRYRSGDPTLGDTIAHNWRAADLPPRQQAMLVFAEKLTEHPDKVTQADRAALRDAGFSDRDIWDIAAVAGFYNMTNRLASATEMAPNAEYFSAFREPPEPL